MLVEKEERDRKEIKKNERERKRLELGDAYISSDDDPSTPESQTEDMSDYDSEALEESHIDDERATIMESESGIIYERFNALRFVALQLKELNERTKSPEKQ